MRTCSSCGSLALADAAICAGCGTPFAPAGPPATPAVPAQVPSYGRLSIPPPNGAAAGIGGPSAAPLPPPPPPPGFQDPWAPVTVAERSTPPRATRLGLLALGVAAALVLGLVVVHLRADPLPEGTSAFVAGGGVTYQSPDGSFQVQLPRQPVTDTRTISVDSIAATIQTGVITTGSYEIAAASIEFPFALVPSRINSALDAALTQGVSNAKGTLVRKNLLMRGPLPAIEGRFTAPDGYSAHILVVASGSTMVILAVHAKSGTERLYGALETSLVMR